MFHLFLGQATENHSRQAHRITQKHCAALPGSKQRNEAEVVQLQHNTTETDLTIHLDKGSFLPASLSFIPTSSLSAEVSGSGSA